MATVNDTFTDTDATAITAHTSNSGHTYTRHSSYSSDQSIIADSFGTDGGRVHHIGGTTGCSYCSFVPTTQDQYSEVTMFKRSALGQFGPCTRIQTGANTMYWVRYNTGNSKFELVSVVAGIVTVIGSSSAFTMNIDQSYLIRLTCTGSTVGDSVIKVDVDSVNQITLNGNVDVVSNGRIGLRSSTSNTNTTGFHIGSLSADNVGSAAQTANPIGIISEERFGQTTPTLNISPTGISSGEIFGAESLVAFLSPSGIPSSELFGVEQVTPGTVILSPSGIQSNELFGINSVSIGAVTLNVTGIPSSELFGVEQVTPGTVILSPSGIPTNEQFGGITNNLFLGLTGIQPGEIFGSISNTLSISATGITSGEFFGINSTIPGAFSINTTGIHSAERFGVNSISLPASFTNPVHLSSVRQSSIKSSRIQPYDSKRNKAIFILIFFCFSILCVNKFGYCL